MTKIIPRFKGNRWSLDLPDQRESAYIQITVPWYRAFDGTEIRVVGYHRRIELGELKPNLHIQSTSRTNQTLDEVQSTDFYRFHNRCAARIDAVHLTIFSETGGELMLDKFAVFSGKQSNHAL